MADKYYSGKQLYWKKQEDARLTRAQQREELKKLEAKLLKKAQAAGFNSLDEVKAFQRQHGLEDDGDVGPDTKRVLALVKNNSSNNSQSSGKNFLGLIWDFLLSEPVSEFLYANANSKEHILKFLKANGYDTSKMSLKQIYELYEKFAEEINSKVKYADLMKLVNDYMKGNDKDNETYWYLDKDTGLWIGFFEGKPFYNTNVSVGSTYGDALLIPRGLDIASENGLNGYKFLRDNNLTTSGAGVYSIDRINKTSDYGLTRDGVQVYKNVRPGEGEPILRLVDVNGASLNQAFHAPPGKTAAASVGGKNTTGCIRIANGKMRHLDDNELFNVGDYIYILPLEEGNSFYIDDNGKIDVLYSTNIPNSEWLYYNKRGSQPWYESARTTAEGMFNDAQLLYEEYSPKVADWAKSAMGTVMGWFK